MLDELIRNEASIPTHWVAEGQKNRKGREWEQILSLSNPAGRKETRTGETQLPAPTRPPTAPALSEVGSTFSTGPLGPDSLLGRWLWTRVRLCVSQLRTRPVDKETGPPDRGDHHREQPLTDPAV